MRRIDSLQTEQDLTGGFNRKVESVYRHWSHFMGTRFHSVCIGRTGCDICGGLFVFMTAKAAMDLNPG